MGKTKDLGHLAHIVAYDGTNHITVPAGLTMHTNQLVASQAYVTTALSSYALSSALGSYVPTSRTITINGTTYDLSANREWNITSMIYPAAGIALSTGSAWGTSITNNSANWNTAFGWGNHAIAGYLTGITSTQVTTALGFTPYNSTNPSGFIASITSLMVTNALGFTPYNATNPSGYITGISFANVSAKPTTLSGYGITDAVPSSRTITINGTALDLSADRSFTVSGTDATKLPLAGGTLTGDLRFNNSGYGRIAFTDNYHGMILRGNPNNAAGDITAADVTSLVQHSGDFRFYRTNGTINEIYFQVNATAPYWRGNTIYHAGNIPTWNQNTTGTAASISGFNNPTTAATANTIAYRDASGDLYARYFLGGYVNTSDNVDTGTITHIMAKFGDNYHRSATAAKVQSFLGLGSLAYSSATIPTNNNQLTNGAGYITSSATSLSLTGNLTVSSGNSTGGGIILADDGDIVDLNDSYCSMRFSGGVRIFSANRGGSAVITLGNNGVVTATTFSGALSGTASGNVLSRGQSDWSGSGVINNVVGMLSWKNYSNSHVIFDASQGTSPSGGGVNQTNATTPWTATYPTLMGWNGSGTYGVRVDSARISDSTSGNAATATAAQNSSFLTQANATWGARVQLGGNGGGGAATVAVVQATNGNLHMDAGSGNSMYLNYYNNGVIYFNGGTYNISSNGSQYNGNAASATYATNSTRLYASDGVYVYGGAAPYYMSMTYDGTRWFLQVNPATPSAVRVSYADTAGNTNSISNVLGTSHTWTEIQYFLTNNGGQAINNSNSAKLQAYSTGNNSAFMSFHKAGHFAINFGLDDDNVLRIGGWSAAANRWQLSGVSGDCTVSGFQRAVQFYTDGWFRNYGTGGLYQQDYGGHFSRSTDGSYGTWQIFGGARGGYSGLNIIDPQGFWNNHMYENGNGGVYVENGSGWSFYLSRGNDCLGLNGSETYDWVRACTNGKHRITNDTWCDATSFAYSFSNISDGRLKENIITVDSALDKVLQLRGVYYNWIIDTENIKHIGLIAQETAKVCPEVVNYHDETDTYSVNYSELSGLFVESTKELNQKLIDANARIELLETKLNQLLNA